MILILLIVILAIIQTFLAKRKIAKWILPSTFLLISIYIIWFLITFQMTDYVNTGETYTNVFEFYDIVSLIFEFFILNIPTIIFLMVNKKYGEEKL